MIFLSSQAKIPSQETSKCVPEPSGHSKSGKVKLGQNAKLNGDKTQPSYCCHGFCSAVTASILKAFTPPGMLCQDGQGTATTLGTLPAGSLCHLGFCSVSHLVKWHISIRPAAGVDIIRAEEPPSSEVSRDGWQRGSPSVIVLCASSVLYKVELNGSYSSLR